MTGRVKVRPQSLQQGHVAWPELADLHVQAVAGLSGAPPPVGVPVPPMADEAEPAFGARAAPCHRVRVEVCRASPAGLVV